MKTLLGPVLGALIGAMACDSASSPAGRSAEGAAQARVESTEKPAVARTLQLDIEGMHCESCAETITETLKGIAGVVSAEVSHESATAVIQLGPDGPSLETIVAAVEDLGYGARIQRGGS